MAVNGYYTGFDLSDLTSLYAPWEETGGQWRPRFSHSAALLSFELSSSAYDMDLDAWRKAGWHDFSYQIDNKLFTGAAVNKNENGAAVVGASNGHFQRFVQAKLNRKNPISQLRGALRQRDGSDTCKAVVMIHPIPGGRYLVAIGFMGTGKRFYDWFSNFRLASEEGVHSGFLQITREFEKNCGLISFPETARELNADQLTLSDILDECRKPGSRFLIWMAGHSQGGAVMQLFSFREIRKGLLRRNMIGYGFASPSVIYENPCCDPCSFPLYHIINSDDVFPRMGAATHMGRCWIMTPDAEMRSVCYREAWEDPCFRSVLALMRRVTDSGGAFLLTAAMLQALETVNQSDAIAVLNGLMGHLVPEKLLEPLSSRREDILHALHRRTLKGFALASGKEDMPVSLLYALQGRITQIISLYGAKAFSRSVLSCLSFPHKLRGSDPDGWIASYQYILTERFDGLQQKVWCAPASGMETAISRGGKRLPGGRYASLSAARNRRTGR